MFQAGFVLVFLVLLRQSLRVMTAGVRVGPDGLRIRSLRKTETVKWTDVDRFFVAASGRGVTTQPIGMLRLVDGREIKLQGILSWSGADESDNATTRTLHELEGRLAAARAISATPQA